MRTHHRITPAIKSGPIRAFAATAALALVVAGCGTESDDGDSSAADDSGNAAFTPPDLPMPTELGENEGALSVLAWPGYAEDGSTDPAYDWVTPFEETSGCDVTVKTFGTSDEAVQLMKSGEYDVVSASGDASLRLIAAGDVEPVNTDLVPSYAAIWPFLKDQAWNSVNGQMYGIPHGYGANLLMYNTEVVDPAPTSWGAVFDENSPYAGKVTAYDSPIYIADAALYLMKTQPELGIEDPYALDADQLAAAVDLLKKQKTIVGEYWSDFSVQMSSFKSGDSVIGTSWQIIANLAQGEKTPVEVVLPEEGSTGWSDTWMVSSKTENRNCAYAWMDHIASPETNALATEWFGEAPSSSAACAVATEGHCESFNAGDEEFASQLHYWNTPIEQCLDGRTDVKCTTYADWQQAWTEIKG